MNRAAPQGQAVVLSASGPTGRSAFEWDVYKNRRTALQHLRRNSTLVDTILETEDGRAHELVHFQVMSALGDKLTSFMASQGVPIIKQSTSHHHLHHAAAATATPLVADINSYQERHRQTYGGVSNNQLRLVRLPRVNRYILTILVECAYTGYIRTDLQSGGIWRVLDAADYYEMSDVIRACCAFLIKNLDVTNCILFYHIGIKHRHPLQRCAWHQIRANFKYILAANLASSSRDLLENGVLGPNWSTPAPLPAAPLPATPLPAAPLPAAPLPATPLPTPLPELPASTFTTHAVRGGSSALFPSRALVASAETPPAVSIHEPPGQLNQIHDQSPNQLNHQLVQVTSAPGAINHKLAATNSLTTIKFEHFEPLLLHDKLNIDNEESIWSAIRLWVNFNLAERQQHVANLLPCMRFPRLRSGSEFLSRQIWRDPLIVNNKRAQHQLAVLDRNQRDILSGGPSRAYSLGGGGSSSVGPGTFSGAAAPPPLPPVISFRDGFNLPCAPRPRQLRPRIPHSVLLAIGGWQQGQPTTLIESYDLNCNLWFESRRRISSPLAYHGVEFVNGLLYIFGGTDGSEILNEMFTFDPVRGDCAQKPSMREARCYVSTACLGGHLYAMGGHNGTSRMRSVERFNLATETWAHVRDMNVARSDASACVHAGLIYIAGGLNDQVIESSVEFYNPADDSWTFINSMILPRTSFTLLNFKNSLLAIGGNNGTDRLNSVEQYNFETRTWSPHSLMRHRRSTFSAALVDETKLFVVGGYNGQTPFSQVEMWDEPTRQWLAMQKIRYDRSGLKAVVMTDLPNAAEYTFLGSQLAHGMCAPDNRLTGGE